MNKELMIKFLNASGSDKQRDHNYADAYFHFLLGREVKNFLEIGISNHVDENKSARAWKNIFPQAHIYAIDIVPEKMIDGEERITTFVCNQGSPDEVYAFIEKVEDISFDVILDDGSHVFNDAIVSFTYLINKIAENGIYLIEDVQKNHHYHYQSVYEWIRYLDARDDLQYEIFDCKPGSKDDSLVIGVWKK